MTLADDGFLDIGTSRLEYKMIGPRLGEAPTFVLLHEAPGSIGLRGNFPVRLAEAGFRRVRRFAGRLWPIQLVAVAVARHLHA